MIAVLNHEKWWSVVRFCTLLYRLVYYESSRWKREGNIVGCRVVQYNASVTTPASPERSSTSPLEGATLRTDGPPSVRPERSPAGAKSKDQEG